MSTAVAFWLAVAAVVIATAWFKSRSDAEKHETLRRIVEKTGQIDEAQLKALFDAPNALLQPRPPEPGDTYRGLRVAGTVVCSAAVGLAILFLVLYVDGRHDAIIGIGVAGLVAMVGIGLHLSTRFVTRPRP